MIVPAVHGGAVWRAAEEAGIAVEKLLDFSANINPNGLPDRARRQLRCDAADTRLLQCYPDITAGALRATLSDRLRVPIDSIVVGEGAAALIATTLKSFGARECLVPVPAFSEYSVACSACGATLHPLPLEAATDFRLDVPQFCALLRSSRWDTAILNNPHNPSGALLSAEELRAVVEAAAESKTRLLLDEAFIDYAEHATLVRRAAECCDLVVVRSLTKFYGCPALRVGYAVGAPAAVNRIAELLPAWPVTLLALNALHEAILDEPYARLSLEQNAAERARLSAALMSCGVQVFPSAANFLLVRLPPGSESSERICKRLIREHSILVRNCDSYEGLESGRYLRVAVRSAADNDRLTVALRQLLKG